MYGEILDFFKNNDVKYKTDCCLSVKSTVKIGGMADVAVFADNENKLIASVEKCKELGLPYCILGRLSNTLVSDDGYRGIAFFTDGICYHEISENSVTLSCGVRLGKLLSVFTREQIASFNPFYGIPGSVGGLVYNNAGAFGSECSDVFLSARIYDTEKGKIYRVSNNEMKLAHRHSLLRENRNLILLSADFLRINDKGENILKAVRDCSKRRRESQPIEYPSLGSVFKKPSVGYAAEYIDRLGLKGLCIGGAEVSRKHAGFIINRENATANDYISLAERVSDLVYKEFGILLDMEVEVLD